MPSLLLEQALHHCRQGTLALVDGLDEPLWSLQAHPDFSPIGWHLGHIAFTESIWILEKLLGCQCEDLEPYRRLFAADGLPKAQRQQLPEAANLIELLATVRTRVCDYLSDPLHQGSMASQARLWHWLLQHESQHSETMSLILALHRVQGQTVTLKMPGGNQHCQRAPDQTEERVAEEMVYVPEGEFELGYEGDEAMDNERPRQRVWVDGFWCDRTPTTQAQYQRFINAEGYQNPTYWSAEGWQWLQSAPKSTPKSTPVVQPLYWLAGATFDHHPVCGVSAYEAEAYARFVGKRLPTEAEWEKAACWHPERPITQAYPWGNAPPTAKHCNHNHAIGHTTPVNQYPQGISPLGCYDMIGNVWEWTASWFAAYPGFSPYPYPGYSQAYFDHAHRVLRGGSWATRPWALRGSFRNWYHPHVREFFAGFRCVTDKITP
jgi:gamma-glutamyl hercynylcysteine S-oxide synthase